MAGKKNPNLGDKLRQEREGAENTLRDSRSKAVDTCPEPDPGTAGSHHSDGAGCGSKPGKSETG